MSEIVHKKKWISNGAGTACGKAGVPNYYNTPRHRKLYLQHELDHLGITDTGHYMSIYWKHVNCVDCKGYSPYESN